MRFNCASLSPYPALVPVSLSLVANLSSTQALTTERFEPSAPLSGLFLVSVGNETTVPLQYDATSTTMKTALEVWCAHEVTRAVL